MISVWPSESLNKSLGETSIEKETLDQLGGYFCKVGKVYDLATLFFLVGPPCKAYFGWQAIKKNFTLRGSQGFQNVFFMHVTVAPKN